MDYNKLYKDTINKNIDDITDIDNLIKMLYVVLNNTQQYKNVEEMQEEFIDIKKYLYNKMYSNTNCITQ